MGIVWPEHGTEALESVAVGIGRVGGDATHVGILHRRANGPVRFLHLEWHHRLEDEEPRGDFAWLASGLPPERAMNVAARCRRIADKHRRGRIPYGLRFRETRFGRTGELLLGETEAGLTCATFVLAVFASVGVELLALEEWPVRPDDVSFQDHIVQTLKSTLERARRKLTSFRASPQHEREALEQARRVADLERHIARVKDEMGCARYRPAEVAGASALSVHPVGFDDATGAAARINEAFQERAAR